MATRNPIPSEAPEDLKFNAGKIDEEVNSDAEYYVDRFDKRRFTNEGRNKLAERQRNTWDSRFQNIAAQYGWHEVPYVAGNKVERLSDYVLAPNGAAYRIKNGGDLPYTLVGDWAVDSAYFLLAGDELLRGQLASDGGAELVKTNNGNSVQDELDENSNSIEANRKNSLYANTSFNTKPSFIEQHISGFFGRGMLSAETINIITHRFFTSNSDAGSNEIFCNSPEDFIIGSCVTVFHDNELYKTYFVKSVNQNSITITPSLHYNCTASKATLERTWFNRAHPGKFYIRELAQRIARSTELELAMPCGVRLITPNFSDNSINSRLIPTGGTSILYYQPSNTGVSGDTTTPVRFAPSVSAYVEGISAGSGAETNFFDTKNVTTSVIKTTFACSEQIGNIYTISAINENGVKLGGIEIKSEEAQVLRIYSFCADLRGSNKVKIAVKAKNANTGYFVVSQIDAFESNDIGGLVIGKKGAKIVCIGDSWVGGDLASTPEREPLTMQLEKELPDATVINSGVGGNTITQMLARFDSDVAAHNPDYVVINTGTNESYNPLSITFDPTALHAFLNAYSEFLSKVASIGAKPIIIGVPALAQTDDEIVAPMWQLNDRAKAYASRMFFWQSKLPFISSAKNQNGNWERFDNGTMIARHYIEITTPEANVSARKTWDFPMGFLEYPTVTATLASFPSNQNITVAANGNDGSFASIAVLTSVTSLTVGINVTAIGRWRD